MKRWFSIVMVGAVMVFCSLAGRPLNAYATFDSGSTGADGAFSPTTSRVLNCYSTVNHDGVFNFTTVNIPSGVTVTFKKNANNSPVTILATGNITINGAIDVGGNGVANNSMTPTAGGPGGFDGGKGGTPGWLGGAGIRGEGPGGGGGGSANNGNGAGGGFQTAGGGANNGVTGGGTYGNAALSQLIGGSGGGGAGYTLNGSTPYNGAGGGGGGGAILIASSGTLTVNGAVYARGGNGGGWSSCCGSGGGGGSGGAIRLVADTFQGSGVILATGGGGGSYYSGNYGAAGGNGYIRIETNHNLWTAVTNISPAYSGALAPNTLYATNLPTLAITSIGGVAVPSIPTGDTTYPDINLPYGTQNPVPVAITATNIPLGTTVTVKVAPATGNPTTVTSTGLSGSTDSSAVTVNITLSMAQPCIITLSAAFTPLASNGFPLYVEGETVKEVRVSSTFGAGSKVVYVTESGRVIPAKI